MRYVREDHYIEKKWVPSVRKIYKNRLFDYHAIKKYFKEQYALFEIDNDEYCHHMYAIYRLEHEAKSKLDILLDWATLCGFGLWPYNSTLECSISLISSMTELGIEPPQPIYNFTTF